MNDEALLKCPQCGSQEVTVTAENSGDHYCHSVKTQDANAQAACLGCLWRGRRDQLLTVEPPLSFQLRG
jgi:transcription elongation factor Elf1